MGAVHQELIKLIYMRIDSVHIIASLKYLLNKPIYVPSVEQEQRDYLMKMASQIGLDALLVRSFMRVLCKISREAQRKMYVAWYLETGDSWQCLSSRNDNSIPIGQRCSINNKFNRLDEQSLIFCEQLKDFMRLFLRLIDWHIICLCSSLTENISLNWLKEKLIDREELSSDKLLYTLFLLMNGFVRREGHVVE